MTSKKTLSWKSLVRNHQCLQSPPWSTNQNFQMKLKQKSPPLRKRVLYILVILLKKCKINIKASNWILDLWHERWPYHPSLQSGTVTMLQVPYETQGQGTRIMQSVQSKLMDNPDSHGQFVPGQCAKKSLSVSVQPQYYFCKGWFSVASPFPYQN